MTKILFAICVVMMVSGCSLKEYKLFQDGEKEFTKIGDAAYEEEIRLDNIIMSGERVTIKVYNQLSQGTSNLSNIVSTKSSTDESSTRIETTGQLISKTGTVRLPLIGTKKIAGMTEIEAAEMLTLEYKKFLRQPYVSVELVNQRIILIGEIKKPGVVTVTNGSMTLIEAIALSGDLTDYAERSNIKILRGDLRNPEVRIVDLTQLSSIKLSSLILKGNDIVYVQPRSSKGVNLAFQEIAPPFQLISTMLQPFVSILFLSDRL